MILKTINVFCGNEENCFADEMVVASVILRHLMNMPCNAHTVAISQRMSEEKMVVAKEVGACPYAILSLTNHSCAPNCFRQNYWQGNVLRAICFIKQNEEISDCYGSHFSMEQTHDRQNDLRKQYYFDCRCIACDKGYHFLSCECKQCETPTDIVLRIDIPLQGFVYPKDYLRHISLAVYKDIPNELEDEILIPISQENVLEEFRTQMAHFKSVDILSGKLDRREFVSRFKLLYLYGKYASSVTMNSRYHIKNFHLVSESLKYYYTASGCCVLPVP